MAEYIERGAAIEAFENGEADVIENHGDGADFGFGLKNIKSTINSIPAADVAPVVHGKWLNHKGGYWSVSQCSECGIWHPITWNFPKYCPNCGAKMGGGDADG